MLANVSAYAMFCGAKRRKIWERKMAIPLKILFIAIF